MTTEEVMDFLERLATCSAALGTDYLNLGVCAVCSDNLARVPIARRRAAVYRHTGGDRDGRDPYVIESVEVSVRGVRIHAQWPSRPATAGELPALEQEQAFSHQECFVACTLRDGDA